MSDLRAKRTFTSLNSLKNMGLSSDADTKFILDRNPFEDEDNPPSPKNPWIIQGRLLINSPIYKDGGIIMQMIIGVDFPRASPDVYLKTPVYHPNMSKDGEVCIDLLYNDGTWTTNTSLKEIVLEVARVIDNPSRYRIQYTEAANMWDTNRALYEQTARETFMKRCAPRT